MRGLRPTPSIDRCEPLAPVKGQFRLPFNGRGGYQRTLDGRWEPVEVDDDGAHDAPEREPPRRGDAPPEGPGLWGGAQGSLPGLGSRPRGGLENTRDNVGTSDPLGDERASPSTSLAVRKRRMAGELRQVAAAVGSVELEQAARDTAWRLASCGTFPVKGGESVTVREAQDGRRHLGGLAHCGRHLCPSCGSFNASRRREALLELVPVVAPAGQHFHAVFTLRHRKGVKWRELADAERAIWRGMTQASRWKGSRGAPSPVLAVIRADETTYGRNGFHHHIHALITLRPGTDPDAFAKWIAGYWSAKARKLGRTCDWHPGWWSEVAPAALAAVVRYGTKAADGGAVADELGNVLAAEVLGGSGKRGAAPWDLPPLAFVEVWHASKGHRWFAVGGLWRTAKVEAVESDDDATAQREKVGAVIAESAAADWRDLSPEKRDWLVGFVANRSIPRDVFLRWWGAFWHVEREERDELRAASAALLKRTG